MARGHQPGWPWAAWAGPGHSVLTRSALLAVRGRPRQPQGARARRGGTGGAVMVQAESQPAGMGLRAGLPASLPFPLKWLPGSRMTPFPS